MKRVSLVLCLVVLLGYSASNAESHFHERNLSLSSSPSPMPNAPKSKTSTLVLRVTGDAYPEGRYYAGMNVGDPPRTFSLDVDTGSDLTWLKMSKYKPSKSVVPCNDPICAAVQSGKPQCKDPKECDYAMHYGDGSSSSGYIVKDTLPLNFKSGVQKAHLAIGYGARLEGMPAEDFDGLLGLGRGKASLISQLHDQGITKSIIGHCLSGKGGGYIFVGGDVYDASRVTWTSMSRSHTDHYTVDNGELQFDGKSIGLKNLIVIFDSGASRTYLNPNAYQVVLTSIKKGLSGTPLTDTTPSHTFDVCWKGQKPIKNIGEVGKFFKPMKLKFGSFWKSSQFRLQPEDYLIVTAEGNVCLGIENGSKHMLGDFNIIGDVSMLDTMVIYDNEKQQIGWVQANCDQIPKGTNIAF